MKLNKRILNKLVGPPLIARGFTEFKDTICGTSGLFVKRVDNGLYLSLGMNSIGSMIACLLVIYIFPGQHGYTLAGGTFPALAARDRDNC